MNEADPDRKSVGYAGSACLQRRATYERNRHHGFYHPIFQAEWL